MSEPAIILIHRICKSQLVRVGGSKPFCEVCDRYVEADEIEEADSSPSPFSG